MSSTTRRPYPDAPRVFVDRWNQNTKKKEVYTVSPRVLCYLSAILKIQARYVCVIVVRNVAIYAEKSAFDTTVEARFIVHASRRKVISE